MSEKIKACNLTEDEIWAVQQYHARQIINCGPNYDAQIERMVYLNKRLLAFKEPEVAGAVKSDNSAAGWGAPQNG